MWKHEGAQMNTDIIKNFSRSAGVHEEPFLGCNYASIITKINWPEEIIFVIKESDLLFTQKLRLYMLQI